MNLYKLTTKGLGDFYVLENDPTSAEKFLLEELKKLDYSTYSNNTVINIKLIDNGISKTRFLIR